MTPWESLLALLVALYLLECIYWRPAGTLVFHRRWLGGWRPVPPTGWLSESSGGLSMANPLPPSRWAHHCRPWPVALSPEAVCAASSGTSIEFTRIERVESRGADLYINNGTFAFCGTAESARVWASRLKELRPSNETQRARRIEAWISKETDRRRVQQRLAQFQNLVRPLSWACNGLFAWCFVLMPPLVLHYGHLPAWPVWLAGLLAALGTIAFFSFRAHRRCFPEARLERWQHTLVAGLAPPVAMRARDLLARHLLDDHHPLAVAAEILPDDEFRHLATAILRDLRTPLPSRRPRRPDVQAVWRWFAPRLEAGLFPVVRGRGIEPQELLAPPEATEHTRSYCPRCGVLYRLKEGECPDCESLPLSPTCAPADSTH